MVDKIVIPADLNLPEVAEKCNAIAACSIRDLLVALGASEEQLRSYDERKAILEREPWRNKTSFKTLKDFGDGVSMGVTTGEIDWSGTKFEEQNERNQ